MSQDDTSAAGSADGMFTGMANREDVGADKKWIQKIRGLVHSCLTRAQMST